MAYSCKIGNEADFAKARVEGVNASYKDLAEVCGNIRRKGVDAAVALLEDAAGGRVPLRYRSHNTRMAHRKELMGQKGRWPVKAAGIVLKCLQSAIANARVKGLSEELIVAHACANKKETYMRYSSKGRRNISRLQTSRVEVVLKEKEEGKKKRVEEGKKKKAEEAKKPAKGEGAKAPVEGKKGEAKEKEVKPAPGKPAKEAGAAGKEEKKEASGKGEKVPKPEAKKEAPAKKEGMVGEKAEAQKPAAKKAEAETEIGKIAKPIPGEAKPKTQNPEPKDAGEKKEVA